MSKEHSEILHFWKNKQKYYSTQNEEPCVDDLESAHPPPESPPIDTGLEHAITLEELRKSLNYATNGKALGVDAILVEVTRNDKVVHFLHRLFNACFGSGMIPEVWSHGMINAIPMWLALDRHGPISYRGISLASAMSNSMSSPR